MKARDRLLETYREQLSVIKVAESNKRSSDAELEKARKRWEEALEAHIAQQDTQDGVIAGARAEIVICRRGLNMHNPVRGTDLPEELQEDGTDAHATLPQDASGATNISADE